MPTTNGSISEAILAKVRRCWKKGMFFHEIHKWGKERGFQRRDIHSAVVDLELEGRLKSTMERVNIKRKSGMTWVRRYRAGKK